MNQDNRVLAREGARCLSEEELNFVNGGILHTNVITFNPYTGERDGDG
jgi:hypothetical protein